jgi:hypothetical protein
MLLPYVRVLFLCEEATYSIEKDRWVLTHPFTVVELPPDATFPFEVMKLNLYANLADSRYDVNFVVEVRHIEWSLNTSRESATIVWHSKPEPYATPGDPLIAFDQVFHLKNVPFDKPGVYEFALMHNHLSLPGATFRLNVLDQKGLKS